MNDFRHLGPKVVKKAVVAPEKLVPVNSQGTVVVGKDGRMQTRAPLPGPRYGNAPYGIPNWDGLHPMNQELP